MPPAKPAAPKDKGPSCTASGSAADSSGQDGGGGPAALIKLVLLGFSLTTLAAYLAFMYDKAAFEAQTHKFPSLRPFLRAFEVVESVSPFSQFLEDDEAYLKRIKDSSPPAPPAGTRDKLFKPEELEEAGSDGREGGKAKLYLAILGQVFDVSKSPKYYGAGGGYAFFTGRDASRAFVSGDFSEKGLTDDVSGLEASDLLGLQEWLAFYHKDYAYVGRLAGRYYDPLSGDPTEELKAVQAKMELARREALADAERTQSLTRMFPPCNTEWSQTKGQRVWCTNRSGGVARDWVGVPRRYFGPGGGSERCVCVKDTGQPLASKAGLAGEPGDRGDLDHPNLKPYDSCDPGSLSCQVSAPSKEEL